MAATPSCTVKSGWLVSRLYTASSLLFSLWRYKPGKRLTFPSVANTDFRNLAAGWMWRVGLSPSTPSLYRILICELVMGVISVLGFLVLPIVGGWF